MALDTEQGMAHLEGARAEVLAMTDEQRQKLAQAGLLRMREEIGKPPVLPFDSTSAERASVDSATGRYQRQMDELRKLSEELGDGNPETLLVLAVTEHMRQSTEAALAE
jgi:hypothetical protein